MKIRLSTNHSYFSDNHRLKDYDLTNEIELRELMSAFYKREMSEVNIQYLNSAESTPNQSNLTKREQFAMVAMQAMAGNTSIPVNQVASDSVLLADALIKELEK